MAVVFTMRSLLGASDHEPTLGETCDVAISGLTPSVKTAVLLDGIGVSTAAAVCSPTGTLNYGRKVSGTAKYQTAQVAQVISGVWVLLGTPIALYVGPIVIPPPSPATAPSPPQSLSGLVGDTVVDLAWSTSASDGDSAITGYQVYKNGVAYGSPSLSLTKHVTGLTNTTAYDFTVKAINAIGTSAASNTVTLTPLSAPIVVAFTSFAATDAVVVAGREVDVPAGTYTEKFTLNTSGVHWKLASGAILNYTGQGVAIQAGGFTIAGDDIIFEGGRGTGSSGAEYVINGARATILNHESDHHTEEAYVWHGQDGRLTGGSIHHCDTSGLVYDGSEQGAGKAVRKGLIIDGTHLYSIGAAGHDANSGQGFWWDSIKGTANISPPGTSQGWQAEVRNCLIEDVFYAGIMFEIGVTAAFHHNVIVRSGTTPSGSGFWGAGILASGSSDVDVYSNVFYQCQTCFQLVVQDREDMVRLSSGGTKRVSDTVKLHGNVMLDPTRQQFAFHTDHSAWVAQLAASASGNQVYNNRVHGSLRGQWPDHSVTDLTQINALPGGGGNTVISDAARDAIVATLPTKDVPTILAAAGIS